MTRSRRRAAAGGGLVGAWWIALGLLVGMMAFDVPAASAATVPPAPPGAPTLLPGAGSMMVSWNAPAGDGGSPITGYRVAFSTSPSFSGYSYMQFGPSVYENIISNLTVGTRYYVRVAAINSQGIGAWSSSASAVPVAADTVPSAPVNPMAYGLIGGMRVRWQPPASNGGSPIVGYRIVVYPSGGTVMRIDSVTGAVSSADLTGLPTGGMLVVAVAAVTATGVGALSAYASATALAPFNPVCAGTGDDGTRVQVVLAYAGTAPDPAWLTAIPGLSGTIDSVFSRSAAATGGERQVRWRTTAGPGCQVTVTPIAVPPATATKNDIDAALAAAGLNQAGRKYFVWVDDVTVTGFRDGCRSSIQPDDQPGPANANNTATGSSVCPLSWGAGFGPAHELAHQFGAVQPSAPHTDGGYHCTEGNDPLCYGHTTFTNPACADANVFLYQFDCGFDDYWNTDPAPGSYLCTHWNIARSSFLYHNLDESQAGPPGRPTAIGGDGSATVAWTAPTASGCDTVTGYRVTASPGGATVDVGPGNLATVVGGLTNGVAYTFTVQAQWALTGPGPSSTASDPVTPAPSTTTSTFHALTPHRILDTRPGTTVGLAGAFVGGQTRTLQVSGNGGVPPSGARAVVLNVTGVQPSQDTFVTVWPSGSPRPLTSNLNLAAGQVTPNLVYVKLSAAGQLDLFSNSGSVHLLADVVGWFDDDGSGDRFIGVQPDRLLDTRPDTATGLLGAFGPGQTRTLTVAGRGPVPGDGVSAVVLNVTPVNPTASSFVTAWPSGQVRPLTSNLNLSPGAITPNLVTVKLSPSGQIDLYNNSGTTDLLADVVGYYSAAGGGFTGVQPARLLDTRPGTTIGLAGRFGPGQTRTLAVTGRGPVPPSGVTAVVLNVTAVMPSTTSFVTLWPAGTNRPATSNLNLTAGTVRPNLVVVRLSASGAVDLYNNSGTTDLLADVVGYFT